MCSRPTGWRQKRHHRRRSSFETVKPFARCDHRESRAIKRPLTFASSPRQPRGHCVGLARPSSLRNASVIAHFARRTFDCSPRSRPYHQLAECVIGCWSAFRAANTTTTTRLAQQSLSIVCSGGRENEQSTNESIASAARAAIDWLRRVRKVTVLLLLVVYVCSVSLSPLPAARSERVSGLCGAWWCRLKNCR